MATPIRVLEFPLKVGENKVKAPGQLFRGRYDYQRGQLTMWACCREEAIEREYTIYVAKTGEEVDSNSEYLGTAISEDGNFVTHAFYYYEA